jgi:hypothetical protein
MSRHFLDAPRRRSLPLSVDRHHQMSRHFLGDLHQRRPSLKTWGVRQLLMSPHFWAFRRRRQGVLL